MSIQVKSKTQGILISLSSEQSSKQLSTISICFCDNNKLKISELLFLAAKMYDEKEIF